MQAIWDTLIIGIAQKIPNRIRADFFKSIYFYLKYFFVTSDNFFSLLIQQDP